MTTGQSIHVALIEDDRATREGLKALIDGTPGFRCHAAYGSVEQALRATLIFPPQVVLLDIQLPGVSGVEGVKALREHWSSSTVVMLTSFADDDNVFRSICNGACGYLLKKTPPARLLEAIREAAGGGAPMTPEVARRVIELFQKSAPPAKADDLGLTEQEVKLLRLLAEGHSYQTAGEKLFVSINTVRNYIRSIYEKLHVHSRSEAVSKALKAGVI